MVQLTAPVQWETSVKTLLDSGLERSYEIGPNKAGRLRGVCLCCCLLLLLLRLLAHMHKPSTSCHLHPCMHGCMPARPPARHLAADCRNNEQSYAETQ